MKFFRISGLKDLASMYSSTAVGNGISAIFWFFLASEISPGEYGSLFYFIGIANIIAGISLVGTNNALIVFISKNVNLQFTLNFISLISVVVLSVITVIIFQRLDVGLLAVGYVVYSLGLADLLGRKFYGNYSKNYFLQKLLTLLIGISLYFLVGIESILYALVLTYIPLLYRIYIGFRDSRLDWKLLSMRRGFILNNYFMNLILVFWAQIDKVILPPILGLVILGNYNLALQAIGIMIVIPSTFFRYILPQDSSGNDTKKLKIGITIISVLLTILGITVLPIIMSTVFPEYEEVDNAIRIMSLAVIPSTLNVLYTSKLLGNEKSRIVLYGTLSSLITITFGMIILGQLIGLEGIAISWVLAVVIQFLIFKIFERFYNKGTLGIFS